MGTVAVRHDSRQMAMVTPMSLDKLPLYVNIFPDGHATLTCAHCAVDAQLEDARVTALYSERHDGPDAATAIVWQTDLSPEELIVAARRQCPHLADYGPMGIEGRRQKAEGSG